MSVLPQTILDPINFDSLNRSSSIRAGNRRPEIWHIQVEEPAQPMPIKESASKISHLENVIQFMGKQHNEVLKSLQNEIETLKLKNRDLQFSALANEDTRSPSTKAHFIPTSSVATVSSLDSKKVKHLEDEIDKLKHQLIESREQNRKLQTLVDGYKRSIPLSNNKIKEPSDSKASSVFASTPEPTIQDGRSSSSNLFVEEALPFSLKPFVVHPPDEPDRIPTLNECQAIIAQLSFHCQHQHEELTELKKSLKDALYSQKWTPDAYLLAKAIVNDPSEKVDRPLSADDKEKRSRSVKIPDAVYSMKEHGSLPALRQTLQPGVVERQKKVHSMQKKRMRNYIVSKQVENNPNMLQPQPPPAPPQ